MVEKSNYKAVEEEYVHPNDFEEVVEGQDNGFKAKIEAFLHSVYFTIVIIILVGISAFCLGKYFNIKANREPVKIIGNQKLETYNSDQNSNPNQIPKTKQAKVYNSSNQSATVAMPVITDDTVVVASKNGTKYHLPTCPGAKQISEKNRITFPSISAARSAGLTPASNCKGLK